VLPEDDGRRNAHAREVPDLQSLEAVAEHLGERALGAVHLEGGQLTAWDERSDSSRTFAIHRITAVSRSAT